MRKALLFLLLCSPIFAATKYVDNSLATGANDGTSWTDAWRSLGAMTGLAADDIVEISGGSTGNTQTYSFSDKFPASSSGTTGHPITYRIGQDASHNGTVIFNQTAVGFSHGSFLQGGSNIVLSGDAGDGDKHFQLSGTLVYLIELAGNNANIRMSYFDLGVFPRIGSINSSGGPITGIELDHIDIKIKAVDAVDSALYCTTTDASYDGSSIHQCNIQLPRNPTHSNYGPDGINGGGSGISVHDNTFTAYVDNVFITGQHMDGWQPLGGTYLKAYNNVFTDMTNYGMYFEAASVIFNHVRIYNNIFQVTNSTLGTASSGGFVIEQKIAGTLNDVIIANNVIVDLNGGSRALTFLDHSATYGTPSTNCYMYNNSLVNSNGPETTSGGSTSPTLGNNVVVSVANAASYFTAYSTYGGLSNDLHLTGSATPLIHTGTDVSSFGITTDFTGAAYANPPSIGAYEYSSGGGGGGSSISGNVTLKGGVVLR